MIANLMAGCESCWCKVIISFRVKQIVMALINFASTVANKRVANIYSFKTTTTTTKITFVFFPLFNLKYIIVSETFAAAVANVVHCSTRHETRFSWMNRSLFSVIVSKRVIINNNNLFRNRNCAHFNFQFFCQVHKKSNQFFFFFRKVENFTGFGRLSVPGVSVGSGRLIIHWNTEGRSLVAIAGARIAQAVKVRLFSDLAVHHLLDYTWPNDFPNNAQSSTVSSSQTCKVGKDSYLKKNQFCVCGLCDLGNHKTWPTNL